jgi:hypothetical protein
MAAVELSFAESFGHELGERDGALTFEEACLRKRVYRFKAKNSSVHS